MTDPVMLMLPPSCSHHILSSPGLLLYAWCSPQSHHHYLWHFIMIHQNSPRCSCRPCWNRCWDWKRTDLMQDITKLIDTDTRFLHFWLTVYIVSYQPEPEKSDALTLSFDRDPPLGLNRPPLCESMLALHIRRRRFQCKLSALKVTPRLWAGKNIPLHPPYSTQVWIWGQNSEMRTRERTRNLKTYHRSRKGLGSREPKGRDGILFWEIWFALRGM